MILKAKTLSNPVAMLRYRKAVFIIVCILIPIYAVLTFVALFVDVERDAYEIIGDCISAIQIVFLLIILGGTSYQIVSILIWSKKNSKLFRKVFRRTGLLLGCNIGLVAVLLSIIADFVKGDQTALERFRAPSPISLYPLILPHTLTRAESEIYKATPHPSLDGLFIHCLVVVDCFSF